MIALIIIGDIIVCAIIIALITWVFVRQEDSKQHEAARIPLLDDQHSWNGGADNGGSGNPPADGGK